MLVVSDTSPVKGLIAINKTDILNKLFSRIIIPQAVEIELRKITFLKEEVNSFLSCGLVESVECRNNKILDLLHKSLDSGESEAIALSKELNADLLIVDERLGRNFAKALNINVIGLIGVLVLAKKKLIIPSVKDLLDELRKETGFWIKEDLYLQVLASVNEL